MTILLRDLYQKYDIKEADELAFYRELSKVVKLYIHGENFHSSLKMAILSLLSFFKEKNLSISLELSLPTKAQAPVLLLKAYSYFSSYIESKKNDIYSLIESLNTLLKITDIDYLFPEIV